MHWFSLLTDRLLFLLCKFQSEQRHIIVESTLAAPLLHLAFQASEHWRQGFRVHRAEIVQQPFFAKQIALLVRAFDDAVGIQYQPVTGAEARVKRFIFRLWQEPNG